jgi:hypothetical protein
MLKKKAEIMKSNVYKARLVQMQKEIRDAMKTREYDEWVRRTNEAIAEINRRIRSVDSGESRKRGRPGAPAA